MPYNELVMNQLIYFLGYNGKSPKSSMGKLVAMGITIIGIPLLMIYLAVVGAGLARTFVRVYCKLCCCQLFSNRYENVLRVFHKNCIIYCTSYLPIINTTGHVQDDLCLTKASRQ